MNTSILTTKLYVPTINSHIVLRPRLLERLNAGLARKMTLLSAPAGFGKTTLVSKWAAACQRPTAWLSLDPTINEPSHLLRYLIAALETLPIEFSGDIAASLQSSQPPATESVLTLVINKIAASQQPFILVLDDLHLIDDLLIESVLAFLIDNQPPQMHLVITTREDPRLPLARLRARGQLTEIHAVDLRFTPDEAAEFLNSAVGLDLSDVDIAALEQRTEGWIAGLQLAAISMQGQQDTGKFIESFTGSHHFVLDYLIEEVLGHQPAHIQDFLLKTSLLDQMCAALCAAVLQDDDDAQATLEYIRQANLFLIPLDNERRWFRYHHLFGDLLRKRLGQFHKAEVNELHVRASIWYEQNGLMSDAIHHALIAEDFKRAADLIEQDWVLERITNFKNPTWLGWIKQLPTALIHSRPVLSLSYAWALLDFGELDAAEPLLAGTEDLLARASSAHAHPNRKIDSTEDDLLRHASLANARAYHAQSSGDFARAERYARYSLDLSAQYGLPLQVRSTPTALMGLAAWGRGDLETGERVFTTGMDMLQRASNTQFAISGTFVIAQLKTLQGHLGDAIRVYKDAMKLAMPDGKPRLRGASDNYLGLAELHFEKGEVTAARDYLAQSEHLGEPYTLPDWRFRLNRFKADLQQADNDFDAALRSLETAQQVYYSNPVPVIRPTAAIKAQVWIQQGKLEKAMAWARHLSPDDALSYMREYEYIMYSRLLIAQAQKDGSEDRIHSALGLLDRLLDAARAGGWFTSIIDIHILRALAYVALQKSSSALAAIEEALVLAEPEGYARSFLQEGPPMRQLLAQASEQGIMPHYAARLLGIFDQQYGQSARPSARVLPVDPLSEREVEVLRLIAQGLSNRQIAEQLFLALSTIKGYNQRIFAKLQVSRRTEAVARARELGLL